MGLGLPAGVTRHRGGMRVPQDYLAPEDVLEQVIEMTCPFPWLKKLAEEGPEVYFNGFQCFVNADCL